MGKLDEKTKNEIDFIITNKKSIVNKVTVLNQRSIGSDHRMVKALLNINVKREKPRMIKTITKRKWQDSENPSKF